jgi:hypothetical protein
MKTVLHGHLSIDHERGVEQKTGGCVLRVSRLPKIPAVQDEAGIARTLDIEHMRGQDWIAEDAPEKDQG